MSTDNNLKAHLKYEIIEDTDREEFERKVNDRLRQGWTFHGTTQYFPASVNNDGSIKSILYIQSVQK